MRRQFVRTVVVAAVFTGFALAGSTADVARTAETRVDPTIGVVRKIKRYQRATWRWQRLMGVPRTPNHRRYLKIRDREYRVHVLHQWRRRAVRAKRRAHNPPHEGAWRCLQRYEGSWRDQHDPYWGGLQMDRTFMRQYAPRHLLRRGWANAWTPIEQMWVAERAIRAGRGFYPWPHTGRMCGLISEGLRERCPAQPAFRQTLPARVLSMGRGDRPKVRWARDRQRKKKAREKAQAPAASEKAPAAGPKRRRAPAKRSS